MAYLNNSIERFIKELNRDNLLSNEYEDLYKEYLQNDKLAIIFSSIHASLTSGFDCMNQRLPTGDYENHFWADPSRELLKTIEWADRLIRVLKNSEYACDYDEYYKNIIQQCKTFLSVSGGSTIPKFFDKIELYYTIPIFCFSNSISTQASPDLVYPLKHKGSGSYADVFTYVDEYYEEKFAVKKAHKDLNEKEIQRFRQEFETMKKLCSPYILNVYSYSTLKNQYVMEYMDNTLDEYIKTNNDKLSIEQRKNIVFQILRAFNYLHSKQILHRDISPKNVLIKIYEDTLVVKISDFGLVKIPESNLTSENTELKGYFNDPALAIEGFRNYSIEHETYALTRLIVYVLTGKINLDKIKNKTLLAFIEKGLNPDKTKRFKSVFEIKNAVLQLDIK